METAATCGTTTVSDMTDLFVSSTEEEEGLAFFRGFGGVVQTHVGTVSLENAGIEEKMGQGGKDDGLDHSAWTITS